MLNLNLIYSKKLEMIILFLFLCVSTCYGQDQSVIPLSNNLHNGLTEKIGKFSIELLYHVTLPDNKDMNLIMSPVTAWSLLAVITEGASANTLKEIAHVLRILPNRKQQTREDFKKIFQWLQVKTNLILLERQNSIYVDKAALPLDDFVSKAQEYNASFYKDLYFNDVERTANMINEAISKATHGRIPSILTSDDLRGSLMVMTSALYFKGQWKSPFNASVTTIQPFYNSNGDKLGEVNMMYNRYTYAFANIKSLQARLLEIPYGQENRLSMLIMLPNPGVSLRDMFFNFINVSLDTVFHEMKVSAEEYGDEEVDCFLPRFKIESTLDLTKPLKNMGIHDLFDQSRARLPGLSRIPLYVSKVVHKAEIEVTEEGTTASAVSAAEFTNRIGVLRFEANRPFCYLIIEKVTNSIAFGGFYQVPSLY